MMKKYIALHTLFALFLPLFSVSATTASPALSPTVTPAITLETTTTPSPSPLITPLELITPSIAPAETQQTATPEADIMSPTPTQPPHIQTGDAETAIHAENIVNLNTTGIGNCVLIITEFEPHKEIMDLSKSCEHMAVVVPEQVMEERIVQDATADLKIDLEAIAQTGTNVSVLPDTILKTGDATSHMDLFNLINTNVTGNNIFFGVINLFSPKEGDIILPYEFDFLLAPQSERKVEPPSQITHNNNTTAVQTNIDIQANTGINEITGGPGKVATGDAHTIINLLDKVNTTIHASQFLLLEINTFGTWNGILENYTPFDLLTQNTPSHLHSQSTQHTQLTNNLFLFADTGNNLVKNGGTIDTGTATAQANVFNFVNTNITGNNGYHLVLNIFDTFSGNIVFPRTELVVNTEAKKDIQGGEEFTYTINFANNGLLQAKNTVLTAELPDVIELIESNGGVIDKGLLQWHVGDIAPSQIGSVSFRARAKETNGIFQGKFVISSPILDSHNDNNTSFFELLLSFFGQKGQNTSEHTKEKETPKESEQELVREYLDNQPLVLPRVQMAESIMYPKTSPEYVVVQTDTKKTDVLATTIEKKELKRSSSVLPGSFILMYLLGAVMWFLKELVE